MADAHFNVLMWAAAFAIFAALIYLAFGYWF
jgi:hypothetical protein